MPAADLLPRPAEPGLVYRGVQAARDWLLGGNTVARVGLLVLFIGVAFLLRYLAEHTRIPIELRLAAVASGALVLLGFGWRLRERRFGYAVTLQGGAIGILYLTVFAAMRLYDVLAPAPAFALLAALAVLSGVLSVVQNARALAALGAAGGFLAPILVSTGSGRIELLLSYYLLLNLGVLGIAWFRAWRELNWIAFAFTFGVMGAWAFESYTPSYLLVGQGFLATFWLLFLGVSLLYALRQPDARRGIFDTTLMFALPLAAFGIESQFVDGVELALAAVVAAAVYLASSALLLKRRDAALTVLTEASFGVGVAFLTLAVPLAASAQWTAAAWALEGVALLWVGTRQHRWLPLLAGAALHAAGAIALLRAIDIGSVDVAPQLSGLTLNLVVFAGAAFASALAARTRGRRALRLRRRRALDDRGASVGRAPRRLGLGRGPGVAAARVPVVRTRVVRAVRRIARGGSARGPRGRDARVGRGNRRRCAGVARHGSACGVRRQRARGRQYDDAAAPGGRRRRRRRCSAVAGALRRAPQRGRGAADGRCIDLAGGVLLRGARPHRRPAGGRAAHPAHRRRDLLRARVAGSAPALELAALHVMGPVRGAPRRGRHGA